MDQSWDMALSVLALRIMWEGKVRSETTINARAALRQHTVKVRLVGVGRAVWMLKVGALFIRFGCWLANLGYEETE